MCFLLLLLLNKNLSSGTVTPYEWIARWSVATKKLEILVFNSGKD